MLKISHLLYFSLILPSTSLRPVAEIWYRVGCNRVTCNNNGRGNWQNSVNSIVLLFYYNICVCHLCSNKRELTVHTSLKYGHVDYMICILEKQHISQCSTLLRTLL